MRYPVDPATLMRIDVTVTGSEQDYVPFQFGRCHRDDDILFLDLWLGGGITPDSIDVQAAHANSVIILADDRVEIEGVLYSESDEDMSMRYTWVRPTEAQGAGHRIIETDVVEFVLAAGGSIDISERSGPHSHLVISPLYVDGVRD